MSTNEETDWKAEWLFRLVAMGLAFLVMRMATGFAFDSEASPWDILGGIALGFAVIGLIYAEGAKRGRARGFEEGKAFILSVRQQSKTPIV
jgi:hypothetical protein